MKEIRYSFEYDSELEHIDVQVRASERDAQVEALLYQTMLSGLIGAAGFGGMGFYEVERWPLLLAVAAHFGLILAVFLPVARFLGWCGTVAELLAVAACMGAAHLAIFIVMCAYYRKQVRELNELQKRYRGKKRR